MSKGRIVIVGAGNLAWHLWPRLCELGYQVEIWSRQTQADHFDWRSSKLPFPARPPEKTSSTFVILAVPDATIASVSGRLRAHFSPQTPLIHTSGATPLDRIDPYFSQRGVLWPIYSLRKGAEPIDWSEIPLAYDADNPELSPKLADLAVSISAAALPLSTEQRAQLHLAATFSNNFGNWLHQIAWTLCAEKQIPFSVLLPIIHQTAQRLTAEAPPATVQTGAAARNDRQTMERHQDLLKTHRALKELYRMLSQMIGAGVRAKDAGEDQPR